MRSSRAILAPAALLAFLPAVAHAQATPGSGLEAGRAAFYAARYMEAAAHALEHRALAPDDLAGYELRTTALLFELKRRLGDDKRRIQTPAQCATCEPLLEAFQADTAAGQELARARLRADPVDDVAGYFLGKIDLNHLWLHLGPLGRRTGWKEYREARESLDRVLERDPDHVRAIVARAWMEYIVATRLPWGTKWLFGGGDRSRALASVRRAAAREGDYYAQVEARFALWEMLLRENRAPEARAVAVALADDFPANPDLAAFLGQ